MKYLFILPVFVFFFLPVTAQEGVSTDSIMNPFRVIASIDSFKSGSVEFFHDPRIEKLVMENVQQLARQTVNHGFRVQVFSSNAQRAAKDQAFRLESQLKDAFPQTGVYVTYSSPFWKVRIGDFGTPEEAREFTNELLRKFPGLRSQTYTVRERITSPGSRR